MKRALVVLSLALLGCPAQGFIASPSDYAAYRETRIAPTLEERLAAAQRYLDEHPDGRFRDEVKESYYPAEDAFYAAKKGSKAGLLAYLAALPKGPHRELAEKRVAQIETAEKSRLASIARSSAEVEARVSGRMAEERTRVQDELKAWLARWIDKAVFAAPLSTASAGLVVPFALSLPSPRCALLDPPQGAVARRCTKLLEMPYEVEIDAGTETHQATMEIAVAQDARGVPREVTISGPDLFVRLEETYRVKPIPPADTALRAAAISRGTGLVKSAFTRAISDDAACRLRPVPPAVLDLGCQGVRVTVTAGAAPGEDDRIVIRAAP